MMASPLNLESTALLATYRLMVKKRMGSKSLLILVVLGISLLLAAVACSSEQEPTATDAATMPATDVAMAEECEAPAATTDVADGPEAPELAGITAWLNSPPLTIESLRGSVVLVDFWTYTCVNCIRTFPFLREWHARYADAGLVILGVHTPEFEFEKDLENVRNAASEHGIVWPIPQDNDYGTFRAFENRYWPAKFLIDKDGIIRYTHFGEGAYAETEEMIRQLLLEAGNDLCDIDDSLPEDQVYDASFTAGSTRPTRELYAGTSRGQSDVFFGGGGYVFNRDFYRETDVTQIYEDPGDYRNDLIYLEGSWYNGPESLRHGRETQDFEDYMLIRFSALSVNAVIKPDETDPAPYKVLVTLDGEYMTDANKGQDVVIEDDGRSFLVIDEPRLYAIVEAPTFGTYDLKLSSNSDDFDLYAFTFGVYESGI